MKTVSLTSTLLLAGLTLLSGTTAVRAETKVNIGVGHMCCGGCKKSATESLAKVAGNVDINEKTLTVTMKEGATDLIPVLDALRKGGFPATKIDAGSAPVTIGVAHLCCGHCKSDLTKALMESKVAELDTASIKVGDDDVTVKAKDGKALDLAPVLAAMEKGGFSAKSIKLGATAASAKRHVIRTASAKSLRRVH